jgi:hypothetical protein
MIEVFGKAVLTAEVSTDKTGSTNGEVLVDHLGSVAQDGYGVEEDLAAFLERRAIEMTIAGVPAEGARSRVETLIRFVLCLRALDGKPLPRALRLPAHLMANRSLPAEPAPVTSELEVRAHVLLSTAKEDEAPVQACRPCIHREGKKAQQRKRTRLEQRPVGAASAAGSDGGASAAASAGERIIVFSGNSAVVPLVDGEALLPARITCYCRHHGERAGFRVAFELWRGGLCLASALSPPILVTDDHKRQSSGGKDSGLLSPSSSEASLVVRAGSPPRGGALASSAEAHDRPRIAKVVPGEGPVQGGTEVIALGHNLTHDSQVFFGGNPATLIALTNAQTALLRLPPSQFAGLVPVRVFNASFPPGEAEHNQSPNSAVAFFLYKNNLEGELMELALQLIGMKLTGRVEDAREVALRIIQENRHRRVDAEHAPRAPSQSVESTLMQCLLFAECFAGAPFAAADFTAVRNGAGQTLAHLAALAGLPGLFEYFCAFGDALLEATDAGGLNPADCAYLSGALDGLLFEYDLEGDGFSFARERRYHEILRYHQRKHYSCKSLLRKARETLDVALGKVKRPRRIRGQLNRLLGALSRRRYLHGKARLALPSRQDASERAVEISERLLQRTGGKMISELMIWYAWIPLFLMVALVWFYSAPSPQVEEALVV